MSAVAVRIYHSYHINLFHPEFMQWTFPSLNSDMSIIANNGVSQISNQNGNQCGP